VRARARRSARSGLRAARGWFEVDLAWSPDGGRLVETSSGSVRFFDGASGALLPSSVEATDVASAALSPDGKWLALGRGDGRVTWHDAKTLELLRTTARVPNVLDLVYAATGLVFSPDGAALAHTTCPGTYVRALAFSWRRFDPKRVRASLAGAR
jgi:WD40 repeat protein